MSDDWKDPRWQKRRLEVFERDSWRCVGCGDSTSTLCVHHLYYSGKPWEAEDVALQTLCEPCHSYLGEHPKGGVYWMRNGPECTPSVVVVWCPRCGCKNFKDKGTYFNCAECSWRTSIYENLDFIGHIVSADGSQPERGITKPGCNLSFVTQICGKLRSAGSTNVELFRAVFSGLPVPECVSRLDSVSEISLRLRSGRLSEEDEAALLESLVAARRALQQPKPAHRATLGRRRSGGK